MNVRTFWTSLDEQARFKCYLMSGFGDAEGRFTTWRDVDFKHTAVRVTAKPHWGFHPKNWEEREVAVPLELIAMLENFRSVTAGPTQREMEESVPLDPKDGPSHCVLARLYTSVGKPELAQQQFKAAQVQFDAEAAKGNTVGMGREMELTPE